MCFGKKCDSPDRVLPANFALFVYTVTSTEDQSRGVRTLASASDGKSWIILAIFS